MGQARQRRRLDVGMVTLEGGDENVGHQVMRGTVAAEHRVAERLREGIAQLARAVGHRRAAMP